MDEEYDSEHESEGENDVSVEDSDRREKHVSVSDESDLDTCEIDELL